jgi:hypothetical protein
MKLNLTLFKPLLKRKPLNYILVLFVPLISVFIIGTILAACGGGTGVDPQPRPIDPITVKPKEMTLEIGSLYDPSFACNPPAFFAQTMIVEIWYQDQGTNKKWSTKTYKTADMGMISGVRSIKLNAPDVGFFYIDITLTYDVCDECCGVSQTPPNPLRCTTMQRGKLTYSLKTTLMEYPKGGKYSNYLTLTKCGCTC